MKGEKNRGRHQSKMNLYVIENTRGGLDILTLLAFLNCLEKEQEIKIRNELFFTDDYFSKPQTTTK